MRWTGVVLNLASGIVGGLVGAVAITVFGAYHVLTPDVVQAHEFYLVDSKGHDVAHWCFSEQAGVLMSFDPPGKYKLLLSAGNDAAEMSVSNEQNKNEHAFLMVNDNSPSVQLEKDDGSVSVTAGDPPYVQVTGARASISVADIASQDRVVLGHAPTVSARTGIETTKPLSSITLFDETGHLQWRAP